MWRLTCAQLVLSVSYSAQSYTNELDCCVLYTEYEFKNFIEHYENLHGLHSRCHTIVQDLNTIVQDFHFHFAAYKS